MSGKAVADIVGIWTMNLSNEVIPGAYTVKTKIGGVIYPNKEVTIKQSQIIVKPVITN